MNEKLAKNIKAILFDLDGTLIDCDVQLFTRDYLNGMATALSQFISPNQTLKLLLEASKAIEQNNGSKINMEIFNDIFYSAIDQPEYVINPLMDKFYENEFPKLKKHFTTKPDAFPLMKKLFEKSYKVVIATTPVLPEVAIRQRLDWAGVGDFPYDLITTIENCRTSKSTKNLLYYEDILKKINLPAQSCLMVGDEAKDMIASRLGFLTFLVQSINTNLGESIPEPAYHGSLSDLITLI